MTEEITKVLEVAITIANGAIEVFIPNIAGEEKLMLVKCPDDDEYDRRAQRRRYEEPLHVKVRKQLLGIAESVRNISHF